MLSKNKNNLIIRNGALGDVLFMYPALIKALNEGYNITVKTSYINLFLQTIKEYKNLRIIDYDTSINYNNYNVIYMDSKLEKNMNTHPVKVYWKNFFNNEKVKFNIPVYKFNPIKPRNIVNKLPNNLIIAHLSKTWYKGQDDVLNRFISLLNKKYNVITIGNGTEYDVKDNYMDLRGQLRNIYEVLYLLENAKVFIGTDGGILNLALYFSNIPTVALYGDIHNAIRIPNEFGIERDCVGNIRNHICINNSDYITNEDLPCYASKNLKYYIFEHNLRYNIIEFRGNNCPHLQECIRLNDEEIEKFLKWIDLKIVI